MTTQRDDRWTIKAMEERAQREIIDLVRDGTIPPTVSSFSELHDFIDANCLANLCDDDAPFFSDEGMSDEDAAIINAYMDRVDAWLKREGHLDDAVVLYARIVFYPDDKMREAGESLDATDVALSLKTRLDEVMVGPDNWPLTPTVAIIDGPLASVALD